MDQALSALPLADSAKQALIDDLPLAYFEMDAQGVITCANRASHALHAIEYGSMVGKTPWDFMPAGERERSRADYFSLIASGEEPSVIYRSFYTSSQQFRVYQLHRSLIRDPQGRPTGMRLAGIDATESTRELEEAHQASQWQASVLASLPEAVIVSDALGMIHYLNPATEEMLCCSAAELANKMIEEGVPLLCYSSPEQSELSHRRALQSNSRGSAILLDRQSRQLHVDVSTAPVVDQICGFVIGAVTILRRISD